MKALRPAFTLVELVGLCLAAVILVAIFLVLTQGMRRTHGGTRPLKDQTHVRGIHQGMVLFAQNNQDQYPVPSKLDAAHTTLSSTSAKDDPGSVLSILIYAGYFSPELTVSPAEQSNLVRVDDDYNLSMPREAAQSKHAQSNQALWDPAFRGSSAEQVARSGSKPVGTLAESDNVTGNSSYAMMPFFGKRLAKWTNTFAPSEAVLGNRGPSYEVVGTQGSASYRLLTTSPSSGMAGFTDKVGKGTSSVSLLIHGKRDSWEGNVAFNDNHVDFLSKADPTELPFTFTGLGTPAGLKRSENIFLAEDDATLTPLPTQIGRVNIADSAATNPFLSLNNWLKTWTVSGVAEDATTSEVTLVVD